MDMVMTESQAVMKASLTDLVSLTDKVVAVAEALNERALVCCRRVLHRNCAVSLQSPSSHVGRWGGLESCLVTLEQTRTVSEVATELEAIRARAAVELQSIASLKATQPPSPHPASSHHPSPSSMRTLLLVRAHPAASSFFGGSNRYAQSVRGHSRLRMQEWVSPDGGEQSGA